MKNSVNIEANGLPIEVRYGGASGDYISLTDIAKYKTSENPGFNYLEFEAIE